MKTLFDRIDNFANSFIRKSPPEVAKPVKEDDIFDAGEYSSEMKRYSLDGMKPKLRREMALTSSWFWKGTTKKSRDTFKAWCRFENMKTHKEPPVPEQTLIDIFNRRTKIKHKMTVISICAIIYGDGFLLMEFDTDNPKRKDYLSTAIPKGSEPRQLKILNPENINDCVYKSSYWKEKHIKHFTYKNPNSNEERYIHPDRLLHFKEDELPFTVFGISKVDILRNIIGSNADIDVSTGEILKWFAHGLIQVTKEGLTTPEKKNVEKELMKHNSFFANDERYEMKVHNPTSIKPKEFYDYIIQSIAAVLVMPTHLLQGIQVGKVEGAGASYSDYYNDIRDNQEFTYTDNLIKLYSLLFTSNDRVFDYDLLWNEIYVGETAEADLLGKRAGAAVNLKGSGIIDNEESRDMVNRGQIELDIKKVIKQPTAPTEDKTVGKPSLSNQPKNKVAQKKEELNKAKAKAANAQLAIQRRKDLFEMSEGEREEALQKKRLEKDSNE